ncbi:hypothetical protein ACM66B_003350 [Microbotryomycetes sp. NB124-2]
MGVVCSAIASVFAAIGRAITGLFSLIANFLNAIVRAITSVFVGIFSCLERCHVTFLPSFFGLASPVEAWFTHVAALPQASEAQQSTAAQPTPSSIVASASVPSSFSTSPSTTSSSYLPPSTPLPGLPANGIRINDVAIGVLPDWSREGPTEINAALGAGVSIIGDYLNVWPDKFGLEQVDYHLPEVRRISRGRVQPVYAPALIYHASLDTWTNDITEAVANKMKQINDAGIVVWLRLLFEMNGYWMDYGVQPQGFQRVWKEVADAVRAKTNSTFMYWAPNVWAGDVGDESQGYVPYWPGEQYVDVAGLSFYWQGYNKSVNQPPSSDRFKDSFQSFHDLLNPRNERRNQLGLTRSFPVVIAETSAPYYYDLPTTSPIYEQAGDTDVPSRLEPNLTLWQPSLATPPYDKSDDELYIKATWFVQMTSRKTLRDLPGLKAITLFNYLKRGGDGTDVLADFRSVGGNSSVEGWFRGYMGNQTAFELGYTGAGPKVGASVQLLLVVVVCSAVLFT